MSQSRYFQVVAMNQSFTHNNSMFRIIARDSSSVYLNRHMVRIQISTYITNQQAEMYLDPFSNFWKIICGVLLEPSSRSQCCTKVYFTVSILYFYRNTRGIYWRQRCRLWECTFTELLTKSRSDRISACQLIFTVYENEK